MHEEVFRAIEDGATVVTATHRLARVLIEEFHSRQRTRGRSIWRMPEVVPQDAFLDRLWNDWLLHCANQNCVRLLDTLQEQIVWERVIRESPAGETLLQIAPTARTAMEAWRSIHAYRLPVDGRFEATDDWAAFRAWSGRFAEICEINRWLDKARLSDFLVNKIGAGELTPSGLLYRAGFDDLTPQQAEFFDRCSACAIPETAGCTPVIDCRKARDATAEILGAALWARELLEHQPETQIGIIVPNITGLRPRIERSFHQVLDPGGEFSDSRQPFHVSLGPSLVSNPLVHTALLILEFGAGPLPMPQVGMLLRSSFLGGADVESNQRALLDASLRRRGLWEVTIAELQHSAGNCPLLMRVLQRFRKDLRGLPEQQSATEWSNSFARLLRSIGWPGDRPLGSREHQVLGKWQELISSLAALDVALPPLSAHQILDRLRQIAADTPFQVENVGAPIQIMGMLEATGLRFDHLWIMGLDDETLPQRADPNPFLPISLLREFKLPRSSAEIQLELARRQFEQLLKSAPDVVMSYSGREGDRALAPSALVPAGEWHAIITANARIQAAAPMEQLEDAIAPPLSAEATQAGGSSLFKDMAACPFRAFAKHRLHVHPLEDSKPSPSRKDQGTGVHKALELIWRELESHSRLCKLTHDELRDVVARSVGVAVDQALGKSGYSVERRRLQNLLLEWLEIEKSRSPFAVFKTEHQGIAAIGGVQVRTRADRVDVLPDGRELVIDYKTGRLSSNCWDGDRPDEPQLPLYCVTGDEAIAGAAFALLRTGELGFRGIAVGDVSLPGMKKAPTERMNTFQEKVADWKRVLEALAEQFQAGFAQVDPKRGACENCGLTALCRVRELQNVRG